MDILTEIVAKKRQEIEAAKARRPLAELQKAVDALERESRPFRTLFEGGPVLIAELKPKSPSEGEILKQPPLEIAELYAKSEADVISVLTDTPYFGGSLELLTETKARVPQTVLRKDFIIDEYQVYESYLAGADAYLLIASILSKEDLDKLMAVGQALGLEYLVEVHDTEDMEKAVAAGAEVIGINNRNLKTLEIDLDTTKRLAPAAPPGTFVVSESGIETSADVRRVHAAGARGILVGTSILKSADPLEKIKELKGALA